MNRVNFHFHRCAKNTHWLAVVDRTRSSLHVHVYDEIVDGIHGLLVERFTNIKVTMNITVRDS